MKELEELQAFLTSTAKIIAAVEQNKEAIKGIGAYATEAIEEVSQFLQGNLESVLGTLTTSFMNTWGSTLKSRCTYLGEARKILVDAGFTSEEAYDILISENDNLKNSINSITEAINKYKEKEDSEKAAKETQKGSQTSGRGTNNRGMEGRIQG